MEEALLGRDRRRSGVPTPRETSLSRSERASTSAPRAPGRLSADRCSAASRRSLEGRPLGPRDGEDALPLGDPERLRRRDPGSERGSRHRRRVDLRDRAPLARCAAGEGRAEGSVEMSPRPVEPEEVARDALAVPVRSEGADARMGGGLGGRRGQRGQQETQNPEHPEQRSKSPRTLEHDLAKLPPAHGGARVSARSACGISALQLGPTGRAPTSCASRARCPSTGAS